jgi:quercetin dioxygenase-like cupin family protein
LKCFVDPNAGFRIVVPPFIQELPVATGFTHVTDLASKIEIPKEGTLSVTLHQDEHLKVVLFGFAAGQELSEHTASVPAIIQQIQGEAQWRLGAQTISAVPGTWVHMPAHLPHAITAQTPTIMLLTMIRAAKSPSPDR